MKNRPTQNQESSATVEGARIIGPGRLPSKLNTVVAEVLCRLLNQERLTGLDAVTEASTTRLAAVVHYLTEKYGWAIVATDRAAGCRDGRIAWVAQYRLDSEVIAAAMTQGAGPWCVKVRAARLARRDNAARAKLMADRANAARLSRRQHPGQAGLFDGGGHG